MRAIVPISSGNLDASVSMRFARSNFFALIDADKSGYEIIENPFFELKAGAGKNIVDFLVHKYTADTFIAYELGIKVQQIAGEKKIQLIIMNEKNRTLKQILELLKIKT